MAGISDWDYVESNWEETSNWEELTSWKNWVLNMNMESSAWAWRIYPFILIFSSFYQSFIVLPYRSCTYTTFVIFTPKYFMLLVLMQITVFLISNSKCSLLAYSQVIHLCILTLHPPSCYIVAYWFKECFWLILWIFLCRQFFFEQRVLFLLFQTVYFLCPLFFLLY